MLVLEELKTAGVHQSYAMSIFLLHSTSGYPVGCQKEKRAVCIVTFHIRLLSWLSEREACCMYCYVPHQVTQLAVRKRSLLYVLVRTGQYQSEG